jgi:hypothetical protein
MMYYFEIYTLHCNARYRALAPLFRFEDLPHFTYTDPRKPSWHPENIMVTPPHI